MSRKLSLASAVAVAATFMTILFSAGGSGAAAQPLQAVPAQQEPALSVNSQLVTVPLAPEPAQSQDADLQPEQPAAVSLAALVAAQPQPSELSRELTCLAGAIYFEAKSETLPGQLAVGRVIVARSKSGRFPDSYCGVVFQRSQFSFIRGKAMPAVNRASRQWRTAVAIAQIAHAGSWKSPTEGALYFHAARVSPGWHLTRIARVDDHVFYR